jgi:hypothetical protein
MLLVPFAMDWESLRAEFFAYEEYSQDLSAIPQDIRGLRIYTVGNLPYGRIGGTEWHRIRSEFVHVIVGSVQWTCEDVYGGILEFHLTPQTGLLMPPYILHTYEVLEEGTMLVVVANTLFFPDDPATHDSYPREAFNPLQSTRSSSDP